ncbi:methyltransferase [Sanguibacter sp. HDW7]|nr:methyltransferase [Sanguibacter sp. HDW7]
MGTRALLDVLGELVHGLETHRGGRGTKPSGSAESSSITEPSSITTSSGSTTSFSSPSPSVGPFFRVLDLGCGTGVLATAVALRIPGASVVATDRSAAAVLSAAATAAANGVGDRVATLRDDAAASVPDGSVDVVVCNPPFHAGAVVSTDIAEAMFRAAARVLRPGGELWVVWNSHLRYRPSLERVVGPTEQASRTPKFTVTRSVKR